MPREGRLRRICGDWLLWASAHRWARRERPPIGLTGLMRRRTSVVMKRTRKKTAKRARPERYPEQPETMVSRTPRGGKVPRWVLAGPDEG